MCMSLDHGTKLQDLEHPCKKNKEGNQSSLSKALLCNQIIAQTTFVSIVTSSYFQSSWTKDIIVLSSFKGF